MTQEWFCDDCGSNGSVEIDEHADVYSVVNLIDDDHRRTAPACLTPVDRVRVVNRGFVPRK